jgi:hypothetical protein
VCACTPACLPACLPACVCCSPQYDQIAAEIEAVEGVVAHGLLLDVAAAVVVADARSGVRVVQAREQGAAKAAARAS